MMGCSSIFITTMGTGLLPSRALEAGAALSEDGRRMSGMGVVFQDYDNDGRPDIMVTLLPTGNFTLCITTEGDVVVPATAAWKPGWARYQEVELRDGALDSRIFTTRRMEGFICRAEARRAR